jgi:regulator of protease activity HflC (stomatin/prohibitin superfamily)
MNYEEKTPAHSSGMSMLVWNTLLILITIAVFVWGISIAAQANNLPVPLGVVLIIAGTLYWLIIGPTLYCGLKIIKPNEALVLTLFGKYHGTLKEEGFYFVNPFSTGFNPTGRPGSLTSGSTEATSPAVNLNIPGVAAASATGFTNKKISLKVSTINNERQKINDQLGNPIIIGIVVVWKVINPTQAVFNVDNYKEFLSIQCDSALRNIVRLYPYDTFGDDNEKTLRGSSQEIAEKLRDEIQAKTTVAGLEIQEARITHLSYAPEIAAAMLQRQQASAVVDARQMIVEGAVGMVEIALTKMNEKNIVSLDDERKAAMVSNLMVVLCGNRDAQPVVNSGSLY